MEEKVSSFNGNLCFFLRPKIVLKPMLLRDNTTSQTLGQKKLSKMWWQLLMPLGKECRWPGKNCRDKYKTGERSVTCNGKLNLIKKRWKVKWTKWNSNDSKICKKGLGWKRRALSRSRYNWAWKSVRKKNRQKKFTKSKRLQFEQALANVLKHLEVTG